ncbi:MAG TPA: serine/threonine-protein phosphatase [Anaerolineales bacterium]|nr:serine/threonine-protein phosphatase [Anaerolineales bacterium]
MADRIDAYARADFGGALTHERRFDDRAFAGRLSLTDGRSAWLAVVADGVGGAPAGGHAADLAIESVMTHLAQAGAEDILALLAGAMQVAHVAVLAAGDQPDLRGLASTLAIALVVDDRLYVANIGDSRVYLLRAGTLTQVTSDHIWWRVAVAAGRAARDHAQRHPRAETLERALGLEESAAPDLGLYLKGGPEAGEDEALARANQGLTLLPGDRVLVCSDGLVKPRADGSGRAYVGPEEIRQQLGAETASEAVQSLIGLARGRGADDNVSAAVLAIARRRARPVAWRRLATTLATGLVSALAASMATAWWLTR